MDAIDKCIEFLNKILQRELYMHRNTLISQLSKKIQDENLLAGILREYLSIYSTVYDSGLLSLSLLTIRYYAKCQQKNIQMAEQYLRDNFYINDIFTVFNFYSSVVFRFSQIERSTSTSPSDKSNLIESEETDSSLFRIGGGTLAGISNRVSGKKLWKATIWSKYKYKCKTFAHHPFSSIIALIKMTS